jgi:hypothetical protein
VEKTVTEKVRIETETKLAQTREQQELQIDRFNRQSAEALKTFDAAIKEVLEKKSQTIEKLTALTATVTAANNDGSNIDPRTRHRPIGPGLSIAGDKGSNFVTAVTICCIVKDKSGTKYLLSVPWIVNDSSPEGIPILQPGSLDGGKSPGDEVAHFSKRVKLDPNHSNRSLGAISKLKPDVALYYDIPGLGKIAGIADPKIGDVVAKYGRTTRLTRGRITSVATDVKVALEKGEIDFEDVIIVASETPFSEGGDSGAPVLNEANQLVGMLFAGSSSHSIVMPIKRILSSLDVELVTE